MNDIAPSIPSDRSTPLATTIGIALGTFLVGLLIAGLVAWWWRPAPATPQAEPIPAAALQPTKVIIAPPVATDPASLSARQQMLAAQLTALEQRTATVSGEAANAYGNATRAEGMLAAFAARRTIDRGLPLGYLEQQLRDRFGDTQPNEVALVIDAARHPVTLEDLRLGLDQIGPQLALGPAGDGWAGSFFRMLGSLVVVHPRGDPSPLPGDRLARVRRLLAQGQVEAAVEEIKRMPGASQSSSWIDGADRYVATRRALDTLEAAALTGGSVSTKPAGRVKAG
ncbi:MAG TPA: hypothetical protein VF409_00460 [Sphingomonas sp.]